MGEIRKVAKFLGKLIGEENLHLLAKHLQIENFSRNEAVNYEVCKKFGFMNSTGHFIRKGFSKVVKIPLILLFCLLQCILGAVGDWKNHFTEPLNQRVDEWIKTNLADCGLRFASEESLTEVLAADEMQQDTDDMVLIDNRL